VATIQFADMNHLTPAPRRGLGSRGRWLAVGLFIALLALAVVACGTGSAATGTPAAGAVASAAASPGASAAVAATPEPEPIRPAQLNGADPTSLLSWAFTPIFQGLFLILAWGYSLTGNVVVAILLLTLLIRGLTMKLSSRQIVSQKRMQMIGPELRQLTAELNRRHKGDKQAVYAATQAFYKERGVSPTAGCLPSLLQMGLLFPMYWVIRDGLTNFNPSAMFEIFGAKVVPLTCPSHFDAAGNVIKSLPCINTTVLGIDMGQPQVLFNLPLGFFTLGVSALAIISALLQFVQSRMLMPPVDENDPSASSQRSMMILMPFISLIYGGFLPAGLFVYWITTSVFSIVQQFLFVGWGSMFPLFGWNPAFVRNHSARFPVTMPDMAEAGKSLAATRLKPEERWASAASTVRPNTHRRASRRGRRR
jgi:YidC/Oxa1 family membrane protein insertase